MNQLNKEYLNLLLKSGVHTFQNDSPINFFNIHKKNENEREIEQKKGLDKIKNINELLLALEAYNNPLKTTANKLVFYDGNIKSKIMFIGEAPGKEDGTACTYYHRCPSRCLWRSTTPRTWP